MTRFVLRVAPSRTAWHLTVPGAFRLLEWRRGDMVRAAAFASADGPGRWGLEGRRL